MLYDTRLPVSIGRVISVAMIGAWIHLAAGCYEMVTIEQQGDVLASFSISYNGTTCDSAGVTKVRAVLDDGLYETIVDCSASEILVENVEIGTYSLALFGLNENGVPIVDSLADGPIDVVVLPDEVVELTEPVVLTEAPVQLRLRWSLNYGSCKSRGIKDFAVQVLDNVTGETILLSELSCNEMGVGEEEYRFVPDKKRELVGPIFDEIVVWPMDHKGNILGEYHRVSYTSFEFPGPAGFISLSISCAPSGCAEPTGC